MEINNFDELVRTVMTNVLQKIDLKDDFKINKKSCLILLPNMGIGVKDYISYIVENYSGYHLYLGSKKKLSEAHYNQGITYVEFNLDNSELMFLLDTVESIIVLGLRVSQMKALTETNDLDDINHLILGSIMTNRKVEIIMNSNMAMFNKISNTVKEIRSMGIEVVNIQEGKKSEIDKIELITEDYVMSLKQKRLTKIVLDKSQLITPLAKDKLRELKIRIQYNEEEKK